MHSHVHIQSKFIPRGSASLFHLQRYVRLLMQIYALRDKIICIYMRTYTCDMCIHVYVYTCQLIYCAVTISKNHSFSGTKKYELVPLNKIFKNNNLCR